MEKEIMVMAMRMKKVKIDKVFPKISYKALKIQMRKSKLKLKK
jgi:hypothetical protein